MSLSTIFQPIKFVIYSYISLLTLTYAYVNYVAKYFEYAGFMYEMDFSKLVQVIVATTFLSLLVKNKKESDLLQFYSVIMYLVIYLPTAVLYYCGKGELLAYISIFTGMSIIFILGHISSLFKFDLVVPRVKQGRAVAFALFLFFSLAVLAKIVLSGAITNLNFDFTKVYDFRQSQSELLYSSGGMFLFNWLIKVLIIFFAIYCLHKKNYKFFFVLFAFQFFLFGITTHKSTIFYFIFAVGIYYISSRKNVVNGLIITYVACVALFLFLGFFLEDKLVASLLIRRALFVPAHLNYVYVEFFNDNHVYWSNSLLSSMLDYQFSRDTAYAVGEYMGHDNMGANNGLFASGFMHAGYVGVVFYAVLFSLILITINALNTNFPPQFIISVSIAPILSAMTSSDLFTSLSTHGLLILIVIVYLFNISVRNNNEG